MTDQEIKESLKNKINQLYNDFVSKSLPYRKALEALGESYSPELNLNSKLEVKSFAPTVSITKQTMKHKLINVLKEARKPLTSREIMEAINEKYPDNTYDLKKFSGNFSQTYPKAGIIKYERPDKPIDSRTVYGLKDWFEADGTLKPQYKELLES